MENYKKTLFTIVLLICLLVILPFLISITIYLHEAERIAIEKLGIPVTIAKVNLFLLLSRHAFVNNNVIDHLFGKGRFSASIIGRLS